MKTLIAVFLALVALCNVGRADRFLIYVGSAKERTTGTLVSKTYATVVVTDYFYIFDVDSDQYVVIGYSDVKGSKSFFQNSPASFISAPYAISSKATRSVFVFSTSTTTTPFTIATSTFTGNNVLQDFGGSFAGEYPAVLGYTVSGINGDGSLANDIVYSGSGVYRLDAALTKESNENNYGIAAAADIVVTFLSNKGYTF